MGQKHKLNLMQIKCLQQHIIADVYRYLPLIITTWYSLLLCTDRSSNG